MADSGTKNFGSILSDGLYRIPNYQRGYAWTSDEVNALLDDLEYVTENEAVEDHYLNSIIVTGAEAESATDVSHVIDGQQRLLTSALLANEVLRKAFELGDGDDPNIEQLRLNVEDKLYTDVFKRSARRVQHRVLPAEEHRETFEQLIPTDLQEDRDFDSIEADAESPSEQKLVEAVDAISTRLDALLESGADDSANDKLIYLDRLANTLHSDFTATLHEVDSSSEAGRIFEAINDRGRDLNRADKIKSYLVYRTSLGDVDRIDVEDIHETFTQIYERLNQYSSDPAKVDGLVDRLIGQHWNMFAGEDQISRTDDLIGRHERANEDLNQIKHAEYHIPKQADDDRVGKWIEVYLESLRHAADAYVHIRGPDQQGLFDELDEKLADGVNASDVRHYLYAIETFGPSTTHALSMALYMRFIEKETYESITEALEKLVMRMFGVGGARRDTKRNNFESLSRVLFWSARDDLTSVFLEDSSIVSGIRDDEDKYEIEGTIDDADQVTDLIETWAHNYSHETEDDEVVDVFERRLRKDNLDGLGVAGWGGLSTSELKNYMLYCYEESIRRGGAGLSTYLQAGIYDYTIEHVWPDKRSDEDIAPELDDDEYAHYIERLGNLAFLSLSENSSAGNYDYETKWERTYEDAGDGTKMFRSEFPDPTGEQMNEATKAGYKSWGTDIIEWRSDRMAEKLADYWSCSD
ncbi:DUF262 domain-containing protein [Halomicrobium salinisoli]|uniref:DUF262 domain-containing protein n=1 Tax=Halomicrobium salinisoli TaxID=2878391 RepID=UPI001CF03DB2|nr:DUF262 domain-containing protein [Halomicrobium salinisoli]